MEKRQMVFLLMTSAIFQSPALYATSESASYYKKVVANTKIKQIAEYKKSNKNFTEPQLDNYAIICGANHKCVALGTNKNKFLESYISSDSGSTWIHQTQGFLAVPPFVNAVDCDAIYENCLAVGVYCPDSNNTLCAPISYYTNNGGVSWANSIFLYYTFGTGLYAVNCSSTGGHCVAAGFQQQYGVYDAVPLATYSIDGGKSLMAPSVGPIVPEDYHNRYYKIESQICDPTAMICTLTTRYFDTLIKFTTVDGGYTWQSPTFL